MKTVYKYSIPINEQTFRLDLPGGAKILSAQLQNGKPQLWALVNTEMPAISRQFYWVGTGNPIDESGLTYVSTFLLNQDTKVIHLFVKEL